jgi:hypothetical protein
MCRLVFFFLALLGAATVSAAEFSGSVNTTEANMTLEAQTLVRIEETKRSISDLHLERATEARLIEQSSEALLQAYCLESQLRKQKQ